MQGAAQTANAAPRRAFEPRLRAPLSSPGASDALRPGQEPQEGEAEDDQNEAGELGAAVRVECPAERRRTRAEHDEHRREPEDERDARPRDPPLHSRLAQPVGLDGGDGGEVARDERQDAGRDDREEAGEERGSGSKFSHRSGRARGRAAARARGRARVRSSPTRARPAGGCRLQRQTSVDTTAAPARRPANGSSQASQWKPFLGGAASTAGPYSATSSSLICCSEAHASTRRWT